MDEVFIPIALFAMIAAIVVLPGYFRARSRAQMLDTLRVAYEKGQPVPPELITAISTEPKAAIRTPQERSERDIRSGAILIAVALAFVALGWGISWAEDEDAMYVMAGVAAFPGFIGLALIAFGVIGRTKVAV